jgi:SAM-dependent methyltransferase
MMSGQACNGPITMPGRAMKAPAQIAYIRTQCVDGVAIGLRRRLEALHCVDGEGLFAEIDQAGNTAPAQSTRFFGKRSNPRRRLGGAARDMAATCGCHVTGIDLTQSFIDVGIQLNSWVGMNGGVTLRQANALAMPFDDKAFDGATMLHVDMNIEDKSARFHETYRVLRPGASLGVYDIMQIQAGEPTYPVPWATESHISKVATPATYEAAIGQAEFQVSAKTVRLEYALHFFEQIRAKAASNGGPPPFRLHRLMQESTPLKVKSMIGYFADGLINTFAKTQVLRAADWR